MRSSIAAAALVALLATAPAFAEDFPATPISPAAPTNLPGEDLVPGLREALTVVNGITQPILQPVLAPGAPSAAGPSGAEAALARHHHHRRFAHRTPKHHKNVAHLHHHGAAHKAA